KKPDTSSAPTPAPASAAEGSSSTAAGVKSRLLAAREKLEAKDLPGALGIYEELVASAGERADVLVAISGDLGSHGHVAEIIELVAPRYDAERHGPATGLNLLQAYLAVRNADAAQHVLDILFALDRPELEERLHGFSNAIAELIAQHHQPLDPSGVPGAQAAKIGLVTLSKPIWFYGLESMADLILPPKDGRLRRIAFAQLATPGAQVDPGAEPEKTHDELGGLSRSIPLWLAETFYFSAGYRAVAAIAVITRPDAVTQPALFGGEWTTANLQQLVDSSEGGLDYVFTGALKQISGDYELVLRVWEVKKFRERKTFAARWTPATADAELAKLHEQLRMFMEWSPAGAGLAYSASSEPRAWLHVLGSSLDLFLLEKNLLPSAQVGAIDPPLAHAARLGSGSEAAALAYLTLRTRASKLGVATVSTDAHLVDSPLVAQASRLHV
ncbi:MAG: hypothetical protein ABIR80_01075, partial [Opitutaceae bacterium]